MAKVTIEVPEDALGCIEAFAGRCGVTVSQLMVAATLRHVEDAEDAEEADEAYLEWVRDGKDGIPFEKFAEELGL